MLTLGMEPARSVFQADWFILEGAVERDRRNTKFGECLALTPTLFRGERGVCTLRPAGEGPGMRDYDIAIMLNCVFRFIFPIR